MHERSKAQDPSGFWVAEDGDTILGLEVRFAMDSPLEGGGFEPSVPRQKARSRCWHPDDHRRNAPPKVRFATDLYGAFPVKRLLLVFAHSSLFGAGKAVLHPVACDPVPGARGRGQGTETLAELGGLPP